MPIKPHYQVYLLTRTSFYKKICEVSMGHGCRQTLLRVETFAQHSLTGTYDKRIITGLNRSYKQSKKQPFKLATLRKYFKSKIFRKRNMTYGTSYLLIGVGGGFSGGGSN